jgi:hypothetical protein
MLSPRLFYIIFSIPYNIVSDPQKSDRLLLMLLRIYVCCIVVRRYLQDDLHFDL